MFFTTITITTTTTNNNNNNTTTTTTTTTTTCLRPKYCIDVYMHVALFCSFLLFLLYLVYLVGEQCVVSEFGYAAAISVHRTLRAPIKRRARRRRFVDERDTDRQSSAIHHPPPFLCRPHAGRHSPPPRRRFGRKGFVAVAAAGGRAGGRTGRCATGSDDDEARWRGRRDARQPARRTDGRRLPSIRRHFRVAIRTTADPADCSLPAPAGAQSDKFPPPSSVVR